MDIHFRPRHKTARSLVGKGVLAGLAGTAAMTAAQTTFLKRLPTGPSPTKDPRYPEEERSLDEVATETVARRLFEGLARRPLPKRYKRSVGNLVHYGTGLVWGGLLGLALSKRPTFGHGLLWGAIVWAINDNLVLPLFKIGDWPTRYPPGTHAKALAAHLIYGASTALALRFELRHSASN